MLEFTLKVGEEAVIHGHDIHIAEVEVVPYRHYYRCWLCKYEGILQFEPDASRSSWTECDRCGLDNEILPGVYDRPATIAGNVPSRMF